MGLVINNLLRFIGLILFQGLILNPISLLGGQIQPMLYILALLMLPIETPVWLVLIISFLTGGAVDLFTNTLGMHISAALILALMRKRILSLLAPREGYETGTRPRIDQLGINWFISYAGLLILVHHLWLFFLEVFRFSGFFSTFSRAILSTLATLLLCVLVQYLFYFKRRL